MIVLVQKIPGCIPVEADDTEIWHAVPERICWLNLAIGGLEFILHDSGATPTIVASRLRTSLGETCTRLHQHRINRGTNSTPC